MANDFRGFDLADEIIRAAANRYGWAAYQSRALASLPADTVLYLRGSMNDWGTATPLRREGAGYAGDVTLPAGRHEFKLATADWDYLALGQGAGAGLKANGGTLKLDPGGGNVVFETAAPGTWRLVLDRLPTGRPRLVITPGG